MSPLGAGKERTLVRRAREEVCASCVASQQESNPRDPLVVEMLPFVRRMAAKMRREVAPHIELDDLVSAGCLGLLDAFGKFDTKRHVTFSTYARHRIRGAMLDELREMDHAPRHMRAESKKIEQVRQKLELRCGRAVSESELAQELGVTLEEWHQTNWRLEAIRISGRPRTDEKTEGVSDSETAIDPNTDPCEQCYRSEVRHILKRACEALPERQRLILAQYYGKSLTLREIGATLGVSQSRVSHLHSQALERLHRSVSQALSGKPGRGPSPAAEEILRLKPSDA